MLYELSHYLDWAGIYDPTKKIYITTTNIPHFAAIMFLFTIAQLQKMSYSRNIGKRDYNVTKFVFNHFFLGELIAKRTQDQIDGFPFIVGLQTVLRQFHPENNDKFLQYFGQYVLSHIDNSTR